MRPARRWRSWTLTAFAAACLAVFATGALLYSSFSHAKPKSATAHAIVVEARPITVFDKAGAGSTTFGKLEWRGGLVLTSPDKSFGGWSALALDPDGRRLLAISDTGVWMTGELRYDGSRPSSIAEARIGPILGPGGAALRPRWDDDSEGVAVVSGSLLRGEVLISFERKHTIGRYAVTPDGLSAELGSLGPPPGASEMDWNRSLESVCQMKAGPLKGATVTLAERYPSADGQHLGWLMRTGAKDWQTLRIGKIDGFDLTDCAGADDGSMLVLERRYRLRDILEGPRMRLRRFTAGELSAGIESGQALAGETLIEAASGQEIDNMEGLAVHRGAAGELVITMISDNNFNRLLQRTVLLQFALAPPASASATRPSR